MGGEWNVTSYVISEVETVSFTAEAIDSDSGGIPGFATGNWYLNISDPRAPGFSAKGKALVSQWNINVSMAMTEDGTTTYWSYTSAVISAESKGSGKYEVIFAYPVYQATNADQVAAAIADFFAGKGVTPTRIMELPGGWDSSEGGSSGGGGGPSLPAVGGSSGSVSPGRAALPMALSTILRNTGLIMLPRATFPTGTW